MAASLIDAGTLNSLRALNASAMPSSVDLYAFATTRDASGQSVQSPVLIATVDCRLSVGAASRPLVAEQPTPEVTYVLSLPYGTDITQVARAVVHGTGWDAEMEIQGVPEPRSYATSVQMTATLASNPTIPVPDVGTVTVSEA